jgi:hypothetical protein
LDRSVERYAKRNVRKRLPIALCGRYFRDLLPRFSRNRLPHRREIVRGLTSTSASEPFLRRYSWWLVLDPPELDLCLTDPGFGVALPVRTDAVTMDVIAHAAL